MKILLIEDDLDDIELLQDALTSRNVQYKIQTIKDGEDAIEYIRGNQDLPDIIILDFNLPKVHGREVILEVKSDHSFRDVPLLILTTSSAKEDIAYAYAHGADQYIVKPTSVEKMNEMVDSIVELSRKNNN
ncbi:MAG TPA: response regulator [Chitinophagaceae bacterium]|nr:response regulator [Chitinophagaceae bacterium]